MYYTKSYKLNHPNPQFARDHFEILDGTWDFVFDPNDVGVQKKYFLQFPIDKLQIKVPYCYQSENGLNIPTLDNDIVWYHKKIIVTNLYKKSALVVLGCDYKFDLYVNGSFVGSHQGGYDQVRFDLESYIQLGENNITIRVCDFKKKDIIRGKQTTDKVEGCFYECVTGIYKSLYLEFYNSSYISSYQANASYLNKSLSIDVNLVDSNGKLLRVELFDGKHCIYQKDFIVNDNRVNEVVLINDIKKWCFEDPQLYDLVLSVISEDALDDKIYTYVGFRDFASKNGRFYVNDIDTYLKGILYQGYYHKGFYTGTEEEYKEDISIIKKAGFNFIRIHQKIESPKFMYFADCYGMYCTLEIPSSKEFSSEYEDNYLVETSRIVLDNINHPCIFSLILFNESWGINAVYEDKHIQDFTVRCYEYYKKLYPNLFICTNDGWEHTISDLCSIHNYEASGDELKKFELEQYDLLLKGEESFSNSAKYHIYAKGYKYGNQPIILSEFGGYGLNTNDTKDAWCYGETSNSVDDYINKLTNMYQAISSLSFIRGICYTQFNDVFPELNGFVTSNRKEKISLKLLNQLNGLLR